MNITPPFIRFAWHKYMFDPENLVNTLKKSPFTSVKLRKFDEAINLKPRDYELVYALAIK